MPKPPKRPRSGRFPEKGRPEERRPAERTEHDEVLHRARLLVEIKIKDNLNSGRWQVPRDDEPEFKTRTLELINLTAQAMNSPNIGARKSIDELLGVKWHALREKYSKFGNGEEEETGYD